MRPVASTAIVLVIVLLTTSFSFLVWKNIYEMSRWVENHRYHAEQHWITIQVAPENPCEKCGRDIFTGSNDSFPGGCVHYFCAHCGFLKMVVPIASLTGKQDHDELWKLKKYY